MERIQQPPEPADAGYRPSSRTIFAVLLLISVLAFCILATTRVMQYQAFSQHAFRVMDGFIAAKQANQPLGQFEDEFALLAASDRDLGRMMAIAYKERMGTIRDRDKAIVSAANQLTGNDLYRFLKSTSPTFDSKARARYINGENVGPLSSGIDLMFNTFTLAQQRAMFDCLKELEAVYETASVIAQLKIATSLYVGTSWETCRVPESPATQGQIRIIPDSI